ncbi:hypothetical protein GW7_07256 [Heterocephalus glaber]|uniref:Uncharacterized protein n=1 Tax=Heterocephalus glaber TaxID=10181 RepID=G5B2B1_HETGA|nr:hypothetical protein GW7_07256 [Heterocephalus glaber]
MEMSNGSSTANRLSGYCHRWSGPENAEKRIRAGPGAISHLRMRHFGPPGKGYLSPRQRLGVRFGIQGPLAVAAS